MQWGSLPSQPRSSKSTSLPRSSSQSPLASLDEKFHWSPSGLMIPDSLDSFLLANPALDARFGDMSHFNQFYCGQCGAYYDQNQMHACTSPTGIMSLAFPGPAWSAPAPTPRPQWTFPISNATAYPTYLPFPTRTICPNCHAAYVAENGTLCDNCFRPPLLVEKRTIPVIGYRTWVAEAKYRLGRGTSWLLKSAGVSNSHWEPGVNTAKCDGSPLCRSNAGGRYYEAVGDPSIPNPEHECGFYVLSQLDEIEKHVMKLTESHVVGAVMGWGRVIQHGDEGWRAGKARIVALLDMKLSKGNDEKAKAVSRTYGVPILDRDVLEAYVGEFGDSILEGS